MKDRQIRKALTLLLPLGKTAAGNDVVGKLVVSAVFIQPNEPLRVLKGQRGEQNRAHHGEERRGGSNAERDDQDCDKSEARRLAKSAEGKPEVPKSGLKERQAAAVPIPFLGLFDALAKLGGVEQTKERYRDRRGGHARAKVVFHVEDNLR